MQILANIDPGYTTRGHDHDQYIINQLQSDNNAI